MKCSKCGNDIIITELTKSERLSKGIPLDWCTSCVKKDKEAKRHAEVRTQYGDNMICEDCGNTYSLSKDSFNKRNSRHDSTRKCKQCLIMSKLGVANVSQLQSVKDAKIQTTKAHYGVENPFQAEEVKEKLKETIIDKYGVENISKLEEIKQIKAESTLKTYAQKHPDKIDDIEGRLEKLSILRAINNEFIDSEPLLLDKDYMSIPDNSDLWEQLPLDNFDIIE
jgi:hypothetical protein